LQFDGTAKHSVYATAQRRTKRGTLGESRFEQHFLDVPAAKSVALKEKNERPGKRFSEHSGRRRSTVKMKHCRSHIVLLFLPAGKTFDSGEDPF
jgi:hypothetical protein